MAKIVQVITRPSREYDVQTAEAQVRDLDAIVEKLNSTYQEDLKEEIEATTSIVRSILVSEYAGSGSSITVTLTDSDSVAFNLFTSKTIASNTTTELLTNPLILQENEILKAQAADANRIQVIVSILEVQPRTVLGGAAS